MVDIVSLNFTHTGFLDFIVNGKTEKTFEYPVNYKSDQIANPDYVGVLFYKNDRMIFIGRRDDGTYQEESFLLEDCSIETCNHSLDSNLFFLLVKEQTKTGLVRFDLDTKKLKSVNITTYPDVERSLIVMRNKIIVISLYATDKTRYEIVSCYDHELNLTKEFLNDIEDVPDDLYPSLERSKYKSTVELNHAKTNYEGDLIITYQDESLYSILDSDLRLLKSGTEEEMGMIRYPGFLISFTHDADEDHPYDKPVSSIYKFVYRDGKLTKEKTDKIPPLINFHDQLSGPYGPYTIKDGNQLIHTKEYYYNRINRGSSTMIKAYISLIGEEKEWFTDDHRRDAGSIYQEFISKKYNHLLFKFLIDK